MTTVDCPKCKHQIRLTNECPDLPGALGTDCSTCMQPVIVYRTKDGELHTAKMTRTGVPARAEA